METVEKLKKIIWQKCYIDKLELTTRIEQDLSIYGDDAIELILEYASEFGVDVSNFMAADHFSGEGLDILCFFRKTKKKELTIGDLLRGIEAGKLDDSVIGK